MECCNCNSAITGHMQLWTSCYERNYCSEECLDEYVEAIDGAA